MGTTIDFYSINSQVMNDSIDRIIVELHVFRKKNGPQSLLLTGCGSGCGTTAISINLAIALSMSGWKTLLIDCDLRKGLGYKRLSEDVTAGLSDYLSDKSGLDDIICESNYEHLQYIPNGQPLGSSVHLLASQKMEQFVKQIKEDYDFILFDFPSLNTVSDALILFPAVEGIVLVAALNQTTKRQLRDARQKVENYRESYYGLIVNQVEMKQYKKYIRDYDYFKDNNLKKRYDQWLKSRNKKG